MGNIYAPQRQTNKKNRGTLTLCYIKICCTLRVIITDLTASFLYCKLYIDIVKDFFQLTTQKYNQTQYFSLLKSYIYLKNTYKTT